MRSPSGEIVAITDTTWNPNRPRLVQQHFTGVHPDHRGRGLGKHIKARMLHQLVARHGADGIERVRTGTASTNAPMMAINARMGFVERERQVVVQAEREIVAERLAAAPPDDHRFKLGR